MRADCIAAVQNAIGRTLNRGEAEDIEKRINAGMVSLARQDVDRWRGLSAQQRLQEGAAEAAKGLLAEATKKRERVVLQAEAAMRNDARLSALQTSRGLKPFAALGRLLHDAERYVQGVTNELASSMYDTILAVEPKWFGMIESREFMQAFVREIFGESTGNSSAAKAAKVWLDVAESARLRFNAAGGNVGKLLYGYIPQAHDQLRILAAGVDAWVAKVLPMLDRSRYLDDAGNPMAADAIGNMLRAAYETLSTGGLNKLEPGKFQGTGARANRGSASRVLHFRDADAWLDYHRDFGRGGLFGAMQGHIAGLSRDIGLVESFGPNPESAFRLLHDTARKGGEVDITGPFAVRTQDMWDVLTGKTSLAVSQRFADAAQGVRNVETFGKLGSAFISSVTDIPSYFIATGFNRLPLLKATTNLVRSFGGESKEFANRSGLIAESLISDMNRWAEGNIGHGWTSKVANATMKATLLEGWTDAIRRAYQTTMMGAMGKLSRTEWAKLEEGDRWRLEAAGITPQDFAIWQLAQPQQVGDSLMLTPQALRAIDPAKLDAAGITPADVNRATSRLLGYIIDESKVASIGSDLNTRAAVTRGTMKGEVNGEILRSVALFKSFPLTMISRHFQRMADLWHHEGGASSVMYGVGLMSAMTVFGALAMQLKDMVNGKDPRPMDSGKFWTAAFAQGGGLGFFGDLVYQFMGGGQSQTGRSVATNTLSSVLGPVFGTGADVADATLGNLGNYLKDKDTQVGADLTNIARSHLPVVNFWYTKAAIDHLFMHDLQEYLSPGYLGRMRGRAQKDWGQEFWWEPGEGLPDRAPDPEAALGE